MNNQMNQKERFRLTSPDAFFLDATDLTGLEQYLKERYWISSGVSVATASSAGEGNMNCTLRVTTTGQSLIVKQSRPWVEKYDQIPAPATRTMIEGQFYQLIQPQTKISSLMPRFIGIDPISNIIAMEDLGVSRDFSGMYAGDRLDPTDLAQLVSYLTQLHEIHPDPRHDLTNRAMRVLNHEYIFHIPLILDNGLNLDSFTPGLQSSSLEFKRDTQLISAVATLGERYLNDTGTNLLHGDFYPGSWLRTSQGVRVIDPEFCFFGLAEFDLGVLLAHLHLSKQPKTLTTQLMTEYQRVRVLEPPLTLQFAGVEIMRRLLGVAQVPVHLSLEEKHSLLHLARNWILSPEEGQN